VPERRWQLDTLEKLAGGLDHERPGRSS